MVFLSGGNPEEPDLPVLGHFGCPNIIVACLGWEALLISAKKKIKKKLSWRPRVKDQRCWSWMDVCLSAAHRMALGKVGKSSPKAP